MSHVLDLCHGFSWRFKKVSATHRLQLLISLTKCLGNSATATANQSTGHRLRVNHKHYKVVETQRTWSTWQGMLGGLPGLQKLSWVPSTLTFLILLEISEWNCALTVVKGVTASVTSRVVCDPSQPCTMNSRWQPDPRSHVKCPPVQPLWMQCSVNLTEQEVQSVWNQSRSESYFTDNNKVKGIPTLSFQITPSPHNTWPGQQAHKIDLLGLDASVRHSTRVAKRTLVS